MKKSDYTIIENRLLARNTYMMVLRGDSTQFTAPGQFMNVSVEGFYLRRPISVCDWSPSTVTMIYKTVGRGTEKMASLKEGTALNILTGLGNGYDLSTSGDRPVLIGGGAGIPPLFRLAKELIREGKKPQVILGYNSKDEVFFEDEFIAIGADVTVTTADGSVGIKGFVTDALKQMEGLTYFYACGPIPMLKAICTGTDLDGQLSLEERMGCGFGACMGCTVITASGAKRVCKDGPVFRREELGW